MRQLQPEVEGLCEILGLSPLHVANEGKPIAIVPPGDSEVVLEACGLIRWARPG